MDAAHWRALASLTQLAAAGAGVFPSCGCSPATALAALQRLAAGSLERLGSGSVLRGASDDPQQEFAAALLPSLRQLEFPSLENDGDAQSVRAALAGGASAGLKHEHEHVRAAALSPPGSWLPRLPCPFLPSGRTRSSCCSTCCPGC